MPPSSDTSPDSREKSADADPSSARARRPSRDRATDPDASGDRMRRLDALVNRLPGAVYRCTYDREWTSLYMGDGFGEITGIAPDSLDAAGRSFRDVIVSADVQHIRDEVARAVTNRTPYNIEYRVLTSDGSVRWLQDSGQPLYDDDGHVRWLNGILLDITRRRESEESLRDLMESLEETVATRTRQVRTLAVELSMVEQQERSDIARTLHDELQQFLYGVQVQTKMLLNDIESNPNVDPEALSVDPSRIDDLLREAIQTTRGLSVDLAPPVLDSDGLLESLQWLRSHFDETRGFDVQLKGDRLSVDVPDEMLLIFFQAVRELLLNTYRHAGIGKATVHIAETSANIVIAVADEGCGFDVAKELEKERTGYGLRTAGERLRLLGANFQIDSPPSGGTKCTIRFPKQRLQEFPSILSGDMPPPPPGPSGAS
ncbi:hypothetical protein CRI94_13005 [Longibacter salinarum]|uniref:PAC domain-containing protein n=1 Tax=Longibacter salinarum TaxID=1850348 RepID=A0A2A8CW91_9BACT|nr:PAS domain-containing protein [Longibacter salinarum]PEN12916.1 hypothetical protein CRI94_13005 [Longibacter salinarum]